MHEKTLTIIYKWLKHANYNISLTELQKQFLSHPEVGNLIAITDTLNDFKIANQAVQISLADINQLTEPFIAYISKEKIDQFVLVTPIAQNSFAVYNGNDKTFTLSLNELTTLFGGVIIVIDKQEKNKNNYSRLLHFVVHRSIVASICVLLFLHVSFDVSNMIFSLLTMAGAAFSSLLFAHSLGIKNDKLNRFCSISKNSNCNTVLLSNSAKVNKYISLVDVGVVYFSFQLLALLILKYNNSLLFLISIIASSFSFYSVYLQAFVIKKWCPLCLGVVFVLLVQGVIGIVHFSAIAITGIEIISSFFLLLLVSMSWYCFKSIFTKSRKLPQTETDLLSFKRNYHLFLPFYQSETAFNDTAISTQQLLLIGNTNAPLCITIITNPLCDACKNAHRVLSDIFNQYPNDISIRIVFYVPYQNLNDPRTIIASWLVDEYMQHGKEGVKAIKHWYNNPDVKVVDTLRLQVDKFKKQQGFLQIHFEWCVQQGLTLTPLLLINNRLFPLIYGTEDIRFHIEALIECEKERLSESEKSLPVNNGVSMQHINNHFLNKKNKAYVKNNRRVTRRNRFE